MYRVPRPAEMIMQSILIILLGTVFLYLDAKVWFYTAFSFGLINLIVHFVCLYNEEKESVRGMSFKERKYIKKESRYSLELSKTKTLARLYSLEVIACLVAIAPALKFTILDRNIDMLFEFYHVDRLFLGLFTFLILLHIALNYQYSQKLLKSYKEGYILQIKKKNKYGNLKNVLIDTINEESKNYMEDKETYNEKVREMTEVLKIEKNEKELVKQVAKWL